MAQKRDRQFWLDMLTIGVGMGAFPNGDAFAMACIMTNRKLRAAGEKEITPEELEKNTEDLSSVIKRMEDAGILMRSDKCSGDCEHCHEHDVETEDKDDDETPPRGKLN